jgi:hypothetical protein
MALTFNWVSKKDGRRLAKISIPYTVDRKDLLKGARIALSDALGRVPETEENYRKAAASLSRAKIERGLRSLLESYGSVSLESSDDYITVDWELRDTAFELADEAVTRLFPELNI